MPNALGVVVRRLRCTWTADQIAALRGSTLSAFIITLFLVCLSTCIRLLHAAWLGLAWLMSILLAAQAWLVSFGLVYALVRVIAGKIESAAKLEKVQQLLRHADSFPL